MLRRITVISLSVLLAVGIFGCTSNTRHPFEPESRLDNNWGRSFEAQKYNQTLNPDADKNLAPVEGLDGAVAERIMGEYIKGCPKTTQPASGGLGVLTIQR